MKSAERKIQWLALRKELSDLGYHAPPIYLDRFMMYRLIVILINHLAHVLQREPHRVYMAALCRAERSRLGRPYTAWKQARPPAGAPLEEERRRVAVVCPHCLHDLLDGGPLSEAEVQAQFQANKAVYHGELSQDLPQSAVSEAVRSRYIREDGIPQAGSGEGSGAGGAGGSGPAAGCRNVIEPHRPELSKTDL